MAQPPSFGSNNPFRRKAPSDSAPPAPPRTVPPFAEDEASTSTPGIAPTALSGEQFWSHLQAHAHPSQPPPTTSFQKPKVVKKVRVQSPPPSSPESAGIPERFPPVDCDDDEESSSTDADEHLDPFSYAPSTGSVDGSDTGGEPQPTQPNRLPPNPFQKTLQDPATGSIEPPQGPGATSGTKSTLDVEAFRRLLLTGEAPHPTQQTTPQTTPPNDGASTTDNSSISRQSISDTIHLALETPRTSHEVSELEAEDDRRALISSSQSSLQPGPTILRKKPPPPSSRHGKLIRTETRGEATDAGARSPLSLPSPTRRNTTIPLTSPSRQRPPTPSDVNKPLPPVPQRLPADDDAESVFDRVAAGKVPEPDMEYGLGITMSPRPPTPPKPSRTASNTQSRKPAPPPRRQPHGRTESKVTAAASQPTVGPDDPDSPLRRSSVDSTRSRSSSLRVSIHAPAPPPPRRPSHRTSNSLTSPPAVSAVSPSSENFPADAASPPAAEPYVQTQPLAVITSSPLPIQDSSNHSSSSSISGNDQSLETVIQAPAPVPVPAQPPTQAPTAETVTTTVATGAGPADSPSLSPASHGTQAQAQTQSPSAAAPLRTKLSPPPPPPARNASLRAKRPGSGGSGGGGGGGSGGAGLLSPPPSRKGSTGRAKDSVPPVAAPPPPPPPSRRDRDRDKSWRRDSGDSVIPAGPGSSGGGPSTDGGVGTGTGTGTGQGGGLDGLPMAERSPGDADDLSPSAPAAASAAPDILADLGRLQREVDALRGRYEIEKGHQGQSEG
ncbi:hypothetical protein N656DRAFT_780309 [Canariomyces notabilis]|uniref:Uncharacterized protein n=1 Tax=Canariomyces notabilis TaxID=2074819 RepID=A0AAN6YRX9_9PEZI|nr:hypothetical protein N656DRAFT_780309 [Canariomyces arenarius]